MAAAANDGSVSVSANNLFVRAAVETDATDVRVSEFSRWIFLVRPRNRKKNPDKTSIWARLANDDISTCTWPMVANEDTLDTFSTSLTSSRPRLWRKLCFAAESAGQYTPFSEFVASMPNYASEAVSTPPMGREGRRAGGLHQLSDVGWLAGSGLVGASGRIFAVACELCEPPGLGRTAGRPSVDILTYIHSLRSHPHLLSYLSTVCACTKRKSCGVHVSSMWPRWDS